MADVRRSLLRIVLGLAVAVLGFVEVQNLLHVVRSEARLRERVLIAAKEAFLVARPRIAAALAPGGAGAWSRGLDEALRATPAAEAEVLDAAGHLLLARPATAPVRHALAPEDVALLKPEGVLILGPILGPAPRVLTYSLFSSGDRSVVLRLSTPAPDLAEALGERRGLLVGHGAALVVLALAGVFALTPGRRSEAGASPRALEAYVEAVERLRDRGKALSLEHAAERHRMAEEIEEKEAMARAGELTAGIVHELRNGLGTILGYARLLEKTEATPEALETARGIREECETLETVIRRFVDFVRRETLNLNRFDLGRMLSRVIARESRSRPGGDVDYQAPDAETLVGDEELLERAFENLVRNAREAAGPSGRVVVAAVREEGTLRVSVDDDGPGIGAHRAELRPFFTTKAGGLGLGLPIARKIVRLHEGDLELCDRAPRGTRVLVSLPAEGPPRAPDATERSGPGGAEGPGPSG